MMTNSVPSQFIKLIALNRIENINIKWNSALA